MASRDQGQVDSLLTKVANNVAVQGGPYTNAAFGIAQTELKRSIDAEAARAAFEKEKLASQAVAELTKANAAETKILEEKHKSDLAALTAALQQQDAATQQAIAKAQAEAETKYNARITELLRQSEESLQAKQAAQIKALMNSEAEMRQQFQAQIKQMQEAHEARILANQSAFDKNQEKSISDLKSFFTAEITAMRTLHEKEMKDVDLRTAVDHEAIRKEFQVMIQQLESNHKDQLAKIDQKAAVEAVARKDHEDNITNKLTNQVQQMQQATSESATKQIAEVAKAQSESDSKAQNAALLNHLAVAPALAGVTGALGPVAGLAGGLLNPVTGLAGGVLNPVTGLAGGLLNPVTNLAGGLLGGKGGGPLDAVTGLAGGALGGVTSLLGNLVGGLAEHGVLKLELCSIM